MNLIARLRGEGDFETAGQVVHYGTVATFIGGIVVAAIFAGVARQLLSVISFSYAEPVLDLGLSALYAWAAGLPAVVLQAPVTGALLGMHQFVRLALLATLWYGAGRDGRGGQWAISFLPSLPSPRCRLPTTLPLSPPPPPLPF